MEFQIFKLAHLAGIMLVFTGLGGILFAAHEKGNYADVQKKIRLLGRTSHSAGLLIILASAIGMLYVSGMGFPNWAKVKLVIYILFGIAMGLTVAKPKEIWALFGLYIFLGISAGYVALFKPF
jgi:hypothetical protein